MGCNGLRMLFMCLGALAGCTTGVKDHPLGATHAADSTLRFAVANIVFDRGPAVCGVADPPFTDGDSFLLDLLGTGTMPTGIGIICSRRVPVGGDLAVQLMPFGILAYNTDANGNMTNVRYGQNGSFAPDNGIFIWGQGANPDEVDSTPLTGVDLEFAAFPQRDGDDVDVRIKMRFQDGGLLDLYVREPLPPLSGPIACPAS